jgi:hypothetical protein
LGLTQSLNSKQVETGGSGKVLLEKLTERNEFRARGI